MSIYVYVYLFNYMYIYVHEYMYVCIDIHLYEYTYLYIHKCINNTTTAIYICIDLVSSSILDKDDLSQHFDAKIGDIEIGSSESVDINDDNKLNNMNVTKDVDITNDINNEKSTDQITDMTIVDDIRNDKYADNNVSDINFISSVGNINVETSKDNENTENHTNKFNENNDIEKFNSEKIINDQKDPRNLYLIIKSLGKYEYATPVSGRVQGVVHI
jgi:hypothetical protein